MTAEQAAAGAGFYNRHHQSRDRGCRFHRGEGRNQHHRGCGHRNGPHRGGPIKSTITGVAEKFGIPRKGVLIAWIATLIFSFPVGVFLFLVAWSFIHRPEWFSFMGRGRHNASSATDSRATRREAASEEVENPTFGVDYEEPWMEELRERFDDLERRTGNMEGYVASGDYNLSSELERMRREEGAKPSDTAEGNDAGDDASTKPAAKKD